MSTNRAVFLVWEAGGELEHSLIGCLRSLLWQLLQNPRSSYTVVQHAHRSVQTPLTIRQLKDILLKVLQRLSSERVLLFLDGLDEAGADIETLLGLKRELIRISDKIKLCVSSRPEQAFVDAFSSRPNLRLQDLNREHVDAIIANDLLDDPSVTKLLQHSNNFSIGYLRSSIQSKAQGVLLWVRLVVKSLLRGMQDLDDIHILQHRPDEIPGDLEELYEQILCRNNHDSKHYSAEAASYFKYLLHRGQGVSFIAFCLAINDDLRTWYMSPEMFEDPTEICAKYDYERFRTWIIIRTGGLLEVIEPDTELREDGPNGTSSTPASWFGKCSEWHVDFIH